MTLVNRKLSYCYKKLIQQSKLSQNVVKQVNKSKKLMLIVNPAVQLSLPLIGYNIKQWQVNCLLIVIGLSLVYIMVNLFWRFSKKYSINRSYMPVINNVTTRNLDSRRPTVEMRITDIGVAPDIEDCVLGTQDTLLRSVRCHNSVPQTYQGDREHLKYILRY